MTKSALFLATSLFFASQAATAQETLPGGPDSSGERAALRIFGEHFGGVPFDVEVRGEPLQRGLLYGACSDRALLAGGEREAREELVGRMLVDAGRATAFRLDREGRAHVRLHGWPADSFGYLQALFFTAGGAAPTIVSQSTTLQFPIQPLPQDRPVIIGFSQNSAGPGERVTVYGFNFGTGPREHVGVRRETPGTFDFVTVSRSNTAIELEMLPFGDSPVTPGPLRLLFGVGGSAQPPNTGGLTFTEPVVGQCFPLTAGTTTVSSMLFTPEVPAPAPGSCSEPPAYSASYERVASWSQDGANVVSLTVPPGLGRSDELFVKIRGRRRGNPGGGGGSDEDWVFNPVFDQGVVLPALDSCDPASTDVVLSAMDSVLTYGFQAGNIPCVISVDGPSRTLVISAPTSLFFIVADDGGLFVKYAPTVLHSDLGGSIDDFVARTEPTTPGSALAALIANNAQWGTSIDFDEVASNRALGHTFTGLPADVHAAILEITMKPAGGASSNDEISIGLSAGTAWAWTAPIAELPEASGDWSGTTAQTFCLDLRRLPSPAGALNVLQELCAGELDVLVSENTAVDYAQLQVR